MTRRRESTGDYKSVRGAHTRVDLNADVGESTNLSSLGDGALIQHVTSVSVACGFHAGNPATMRAAVITARDHGVAVGAHPGLQDSSGFGRVPRVLASQEVEDLVVQQIEALAAVAAAEGVRLSHVKPHGALYHMVSADPNLAAALVRGVVSVDRALIVYGPPRSHSVMEAARSGLRTAVEGFADRGYRSDGTLLPRETPGSVLHDPEIVSKRAVQMALDATVSSVDGVVISMSVETICVHGDTPGAAALAAGVRSALLEAGVDVRRLD